MFNNKTILITGGTGSFGKAFIDYVIVNYSPQKLIILSRDEFKQYEMQSVYPETKYDFIRYFLGDVRDVERLKQAFNGVHYVVHAAALKQVPAAEYNPFECIKTNINGAENVITAAIYNRVQKVIALSTDKAVNPINLYGSTKLASDKAFVAGNNLSGDAKTKFSVVRYGNVLGSRGSVVPFFRKLIEEGAPSLPITDPRMTRFWITLGEAVKFVIASFERMDGGEVYVPKIPSMHIVDLASAMAPDMPTTIVGIRPGEKLHEAMISHGDSHSTLEGDDFYTVLPSWYTGEEVSAYGKERKLTPVADRFEYCSDTNPDMLSADKLRENLR